MSELYERIENFCKERKVNITQMCREANVPRAALTDLKMGRSKELSIKTLDRIADYFNVSVDSIIGKEQKKPPTSRPTDERITFDDFTYAMQNETKDLTDMDKQLLLSMAKQLNDARKQRNGEHK